MKVLFLGCHCDDIELGCGATIHKHKNDWDIYCSVFCSQGYKDGSLHFISDISAKALKHLGAKHLEFSTFAPDCFHTQRQQILELLMNLKKTIEPKIIFVNNSDEHQDHETLYKESIRVFRQDTLLTYPVCRSQRSFCPNTFEQVSIEDVNIKLESARMYKGFYGAKNYFNEDNLLASLRSNGIYFNAEFAEVYKTITRVGV